MNAEQVARLTAHGVQIDHIPGGSAAVTTQDIAAALAKATKFQQSLILARYADDEAERSKAWARWFLICMDERQRQGWHTHPGQVEDFSAITLAEFLFPRVALCHRCNGTKEVKAGPKIYTCGECSGTGWAKYPSGLNMEAVATFYGGPSGNPWPRRIEWARGFLQRECEAGLGVAR